MPSPQQEAASAQCIFCKIIKGEVQSFRVYEDALSIAILDINPGAKGHLLLLPKEHHSLLPNMPEELIAHLGQVAKWLAHTTKKVMVCDGVDIFGATGGLAGQNAPHVMLHIIPRFNNDKIEIDLKLQRAAPEQLIKIRQALAGKIKEHLGYDVKKGGEPAQKPAAQENPEPEKEASAESPNEGKVESQAEEEVGLDDIASLLGGGK